MGMAGAAIGLTAAAPDTSAAVTGAVTIARAGQPLAQIVVAATHRPRMATLAALELRRHVERISGARLPVVTTPTGTAIRVYVGRSPATDTLGVTTEGLKYGAYRMVSGPDWIALLGDDFDFDAGRLPLPAKRNDPTGRDRWEATVKASGLTDTGWGYPFAGSYKQLWSPNDFDSIFTSAYGADAVALWMSGGNSVKGFWHQDEGGSCNAVYAFLRGLGARWFMPGDLGEVLPRTATLTAGPFDETSRPDYPVRSWSWYNYGAFAFDDVLWARRIGMNAGYQYLGPMHGVHGLVPVHSTEAMRKVHPEYYALIAGKRDIEHREHGTACYSSKGLEKETVNYIRFLFDTYDLPHVGIWPGDGLKKCQCEGCKDKTASEMVWEFADRVAREVYKTHPNKRITCGAYTSYIDAPDTIQKFSPNLAVWIANSGRPRMTDPEHWAEYWARVQKWQSKMAPGNILRLENNRFHVWGFDNGVRGRPLAYPVIHPRAVARDLKALRGISGGDIGEQSQVTGRWKVMGLEHITLYTQARFLWDATLDVDQVLDEYCRMFYGPAASHMKAAIDFAEKNLALKDESRGRGRGDPSNVPLKTALKLRDLLDQARTAAGDGVHGQRVQAVIDCLQPRAALIAARQGEGKELAEQRAKAPMAVGVNGADLSRATAYDLRSPRPSQTDSPRTSFKVGWSPQALILEVTCKEPDMGKLKVADDVNSGDYIAISIETSNHSYYHLEINPDGKLLDGDPNPGWKSLADVKTERGTDFWRVRLSLPVVGDKEAEADPNHRVAGSKPTAVAPWYFNVGRCRVTGSAEPPLQMVSPTGGGWHVPARFARLEIP